MPVARVTTENDYILLVQIKSDRGQRPIRMITMIVRPGVVENWPFSILLVPEHIQHVSESLRARQLPHSLEAVSTCLPKSFPDHLESLILVSVKEWIWPNDTDFEPRLC